MGMVIWITGVPGSGKSTLADEVLKAEPHMRLLRMDEMRRIVTPSPTYSPQERDLLYRAIVYTAWRLSAIGEDVLIDATAHKLKWRALARELIADFAEVRLTCPTDVCISREQARLDTHAAPRGIYEKAACGAPVPGMAEPYEPSPEADLVIDSAGVTLKDEVFAVTRLISAMRMGAVRPV